MLKKLYLRHFRNYTEVEVAFSPGINWLVGNNAQGKTNLLEALYLLSCGRSFRTSQLSQLIQKGASYFAVEGMFEKDQVDQSIQLAYNGEGKRLKINATLYPQFTPLIGLLPLILYAPEDITLIGGAPATRRKFLDLQLAQVDPLYLHHLARYHRALKQRNALLKQRREELIDTWEELMAPSALYLMQKRSALVESLQNPLRIMVETLSSGADHLSIHYQPSLLATDCESIARALQQQRKKELDIGTTLSGPHRDDMLFSIGELAAKAYASAGQKHAIISALRLCLWQLVKEETGTTPVFGVDDFGAHLDRTRQRKFEAHLQGLGQIFLTSPLATTEALRGIRMFEVSSGKVFQVSRT